MGTQNNRLNETALLRTQNMFKLMGTKLFTIYAKIVLLNLWIYIVLLP